MPLEVATYISDLVSSNPAHTDGLNATDAHERLIKSTLKNTFPNFTAAPVNSTQEQIDAATGAAAGTSGSKFPLGSAGAPSITPLGNHLTGIYSAGTDKVDVSVNGTLVAEVNAAGVAVSGALGATGGLVIGGNASIAGTLALGVQPITGGTGQLVPTGTIHTWLTGTAPTGYLFANGQLVSRTTYAALFALWGTTFGAGDGSTTFGLPDLRDVVEIGQTTMGGVSARGLLTNQTITTIGAVVGECAHALVAAENAPHVHTTTEIPHSHAIHSSDTTGLLDANTGGFRAVRLDNMPTLAAGGGSNWGTTDTASTGLTVNSQGSGTAHNNVQQSFVVTKIIKT